MKELLLLRADRILLDLDQKPIGCASLKVDASRFRVVFVGVCGRSRRTEHDHRAPPLSLWDRGQFLLCPRNGLKNLVGASDREGLSLAVDLEKFRVDRGVVFDAHFDFHALFCFRRRVIR